MIISKHIREKIMLLALCTPFYCVHAASQNINGEKIIVGKESITIINFPGKVLNINFSDDVAYDYYIFKRREEKSISIQFNKEKKEAPNTGLLINEGGRSHMFKIAFDPTYDINDDSRPPLWYDHSDLKDLKAFVQKQKEISANPVASIEKENEQQKQDAIARKAEAATAQKQLEAEAAKKTAALQEQSKKEADQQKQQAAELAKAKQEADDKEKQVQADIQKTLAVKKAAEEQAKKDAELLAQQKAKEAQQIKALKESKDAEALAKAQKEAAEKQKIQDEKLALKKQQDDEKQQKAADELAKKISEQKASQERLAKLEEEKKQQEVAKAYSSAGLWKRYGSKGIDLYNFPRNQINTVNSDFYIASDTLRNYQIAETLIKEDLPDKLNIPADQPINKGVKLTLENITFKNVHTYYKIKIENNTNEDFLMGRTYMYWYDAAEKAKMIIKGSYLTYIGFFPLVQPQTTHYVVFVTRSPNVVNEESLVLFVDERRKEKGTASIIIKGADYNKELGKVQTLIKNNEKIITQEQQEPLPGKKKSRSNNKK